MLVSVTGKHMKIGDSLNGYIQETVDGLTHKYFDKSIEATVVVSKESTGITSDVSVHIGKGIVARGHHKADDAYLSVDGAVTRLEAQLRKYKNRLRDHHMNQLQAEQESRMAAQYVIEDNQAAANDANRQPAIIAELEMDIPTLRVADAVMRMNLSGADFFLFRSAVDGGYNLVHKRDDGNIGWIDPAGIKDVKSI